MQKYKNAQNLLKLLTECHKKFNYITYFCKQTNMEKILIMYIFILTVLETRIQTKAGDRIYTSQSTTA